MQRLFDLFNRHGITCVFEGEGGDGGAVDGVTGVATGEAPDLSFDPKTLVGHKGVDGKDFFSEAQIEKFGALADKFGGETGQAKLAKAYLTMEAMQGKLSQPLADNATENDKAERRKAVGAILGLPDGPDGYAFADPIEAPEGIVPPELDAQLKVLAHQGQMTNESAQGVRTLFINHEIGKIETEQKAKVTAQENATIRLKSAWKGSEFEANKVLVSSWLRENCGSDEEHAQFTKEANEQGYGNNVVLMKALLPAAVEFSQRSESTTVEGEKPVYDKHGKKLSQWEIEFPKSGADPARKQ